MRRIRFPMLLLLAFALVSLVPAHSSAQVNFTDVTTNDEFYGHVTYIASLGIIKGYEENGVSKFKPYNNLTRFQAAKMLIEATGKTSYNANTVQFKDLAPGNEYYFYLSKAVALGYLQKNSDGSIKPFEYIKRDDMGHALATAFGISQKIDAEHPLAFPDMIGHKYAEEINGLYYAGVAQGSNGKFGPNEYLKRSQFTMFLARVMDDTFALPVQKPDVSATSFYIKVDTGGDLLNIRSTPSTSGAVLGKLNHGDVVEVHKVEGEWLLIMYNNTPGYIHGAFTEVVDQQPTTPSTPATPPPAAVVTTVGKVTVNSLNVRSGAGVEYPVIDKLNTGQMVNVLSINGGWVKVSVNNKVGFVSKTYLKLTNKTGHPLQNRIIVIDAGHGGTDPGTSKSGVTEKSINLKVAKRVEAKLKAAGANVLMTRSDDRFPSLEDRVAFAKRNYAEAFVSIHVNAAGSTAAKGAEVFYSSENDNGVESKVLATYIQNNLVKQAQMYNRGVFDKRFYVVRNNNVAAVLVELGFITNPDDFKKLTSEAYMEIYAEAIFQGLVQYYSIP